MKIKSRRLINQEKNFPKYITVIHQFEKLNLIPHIHVDEDIKNNNCYPCI